MSEANSEKVLLDAITDVYRQLNHPMKAGKVWVTYPREQIDEVLDSIRVAVVKANPKYTGKESA